ncbi:MAG: HigA family addiction module antitoxin [Nostoc sp. CmiVER01]|uniref:HigA family addiction module antitoxin n=1 Tax=Nostoc sp. CmiVER01 TaxID=3075384 RepID=UPI002AD49A8E|nr:HigA family addiction module antitoxin [Nostoc sp. CmiVER01]MDZ8125223.1 HigA family addiction module antitoxin [Nostoc sp. CmiVER01]
MDSWQDITDDRLVRPIHPGEVIADILDHLDINTANFAENLGVSNQTVQKIINGQRVIIVDIAIRLGKVLGNGLRLWLNLQQKVELWDAWQSHKEEIQGIEYLL